MLSRMTKILSTGLLLLAFSLPAQSVPFVVDFDDSNFNLNNILPLNPSMPLFDAPTSITGTMSVNGFGDVDGLSISVIDANGTHTFTGENGNYRQIGVGGGLFSMLINFGSGPFGLGTLTGSIGGFTLDSFNLDFRGPFITDALTLPTSNFMFTGVSRVTLNFLSSTQQEGILVNAGSMDNASITVPSGTVPESGSLALMAVGLMGLSLRRRKSG